MSGISGRSRQLIESYHEATEAEEENLCSKVTVRRLKLGSNSGFTIATGAKVLTMVLQALNPNARKLIHVQKSGLNIEVPRFHGW